jgi:hypothetical protein
MKWVTRERPVIDRIACPWLIARFIDKQPEFLFVPPDQVTRVAAETGATPYGCRGSSLRTWATAVVSTVSYPSMILETIRPLSRFRRSFAVLTPIAMISHLNRQGCWPFPWVCET